MKILTLHSDYISFKPLKKALKSIAELSDAEKIEKKIEDVLVVLTAVEKGDDIKDTLKKYVENVKDIAKQVNATNIVLYPYAHLSSDLALPDIAQEILKGAENELKKVKGMKVERAPFGYYKSFEVKVKGHPLSELSRSIGGGREGNVKSAHPPQNLRPRHEGGGNNQENSVVNQEGEVDVKNLLRSLGKSTLDRSKLKQNDHRILGIEMDLFSFSDVAPGSPFWHNNGLIIYNELIKFMREELRKRNYEEIKTPEILDKKLWQISGHWEKYRDNIFISEYENKTYAAKPMNCPGGLIVYRNSPKSYKELPLRVAEFGIVHRQELSGVLAGLFRVIEFTQDDAHIFCGDNEKEIESEVSNIIELIDFVYKKFGFEYRVELSTRPEKRIGSDKVWDKAEKALESVLKKNKIKYKINKGDGAFYGPKIDFHIKDSLSRSWQLGTIQLDFSMPERFNLEYRDKEDKHKTPVMIHRAILGSVERFIGILLEDKNGRLPTWLAPIQVRVLNFTDRNNKSVEKFTEKLIEEGIRAESDLRSEPLGGKVRDAELMRIPYIVTIGDREEKDGTLAVRIRGDGKLKTMKIGEFLEKIKEEIEKRK